MNVPDLPAEQIVGIRFAPTCVEEYALRYVERADPMGVPYYWAPRGRLTDVAGMDVDARWVAEGYAVLTPLTYDLTDRASMETLKRDWLSERGNT